MSSHREAPGISFDPAADNTDVYAFVSPDNPDTVTLIANYVPLEGPDGGPNFYEFADDVRYEIHISNSDSEGAEADITYRFTFRTELSNDSTFLYNTGPITKLDSKNWNRKQFYTAERYDRHGWHTIVKHAPSPPCNIGPASTPNYANLAEAAVHDTSEGGKVFAGQRAEGFYVDLGAIFDLGDLRPLQNLNAFNGMPAADGVNSTKNLNVHSIALQVPKSKLSASAMDAGSRDSVIGVWATASRQKVAIRGKPDLHEILWQGPYVQVSRLGNPLFNEVLIALARKDFWNSQQPKNDKQFADRVAHPELAKLLPTLYPDVFPNLKNLDDKGTERKDLEAVLLTGIPAGTLEPAPKFQNYTGDTQADMLRLNMAIPPTSKDKAKNLGLLALDAAGFPNGRRVFDDVTTIELRAIAGATLALVKGSGYTADDAVEKITEGLTSGESDLTAEGTEDYLDQFPYLGTPHSGYNVPKS